MASRVDVVIVGADAAGLSAGKSAGAHGHSFVLLEASHRRTSGRYGGFRPGTTLSISVVTGCIRRVSIPSSASRSVSDSAIAVKAAGTRRSITTALSSTARTCATSTPWSRQANDCFRPVRAIAAAAFPTRRSHRRRRRQFGQPMGAVPCLPTVAGLVQRSGSDRCRRYRGLQRHGRGLAGDRQIRHPTVAAWAADVPVTQRLLADPTRTRSRIARMAAGGCQADDPSRSVVAAPATIERIHDKIAGGLGVKMALPDRDGDSATEAW